MTKTTVLKMTFLTAVLAVTAACAKKEQPVAAPAADAMAAPAAAAASTPEGQGGGETLKQ